ncbi:hypothetical protein GJ496_007887 [Pomphorhynchus laevis]|nr:hypothetical protein GJ496_007887 [Pomphorhynchus laevis]
MTNNDIRVLLVGSGGIGCEILKNLVLMNYTHIDVVDMDTIELSNLNRQFLFRQSHVGQPKAVTAVNSILQFAPDRDINALVSDITTYGAEFFRNYTIVFNALDNKKARSYVNRMCVAVNCPLIESGSSGYSGQACPIIPYQTECYDCTPKPATKSYPGCTIRNTPSEFIHCVVWAKSLFNQLFGQADELGDDNDVSPDQSDDVNAEVSKKHISMRKLAEQYEYDEKLIFKKVFNDDINVLLSMSNLWVKRVPPKPIILEPSTTSENIKYNDETQTFSDLKIPNSVCELADIFFESVNEIKKCIPLSFDKDDQYTIDFVYASANLRAEAFHIPMSSKFDVKSKAGNIIPAIASTNAIVAALAVHQGDKLIMKSKSESIDSCCVYVKPKQLTPMLCSALPNPDCFVCGGHLGITVSLNTNHCTLADLRKFITDKLGSDIIDLILADGRLLPDDLNSSKCLLSNFGIGKAGASLLTAETDDDDRVQIIVSADNSIKGTQIISHQNRGIKRKRKSSIVDSVNTML